MNSPADSKNTPPQDGPDQIARPATTKRSLRDAARRQRAAKSDKDSASDEILDRLLQLPDYRHAEWVLWYLHIGDEVRTQSTVAALLARGTAVVIPYCVEDHLELFHCRSMSDLASGRFKILEPRPELRSDPARRIEPRRLDAIIVPGLAFDRHGGRLGYGRGFYDRCLAESRPDAVKIAIAYDCQLFDSIPTDPHDIPMDWIVTESESIRCTAGGGGIS
jgi:5-formyltetrahydrofolate cyclo-ligase